MHNSTQSQIITAEQQLRTAMLQSNVSILGDLLADELIFTNHLGQILTKNDDLAAHRSGLLNIERLQPSEQRIQIVGNVAIVTVLVNIVGSYASETSEHDFRFTRIWRKTDQNTENTWQVIVAHSTIVTPERKPKS